MVAFAYSVNAQIRYLVSHVSKHNMSDTTAELKQVGIFLRFPCIRTCPKTGSVFQMIALYGDNAALYMLSCMLQDLDLSAKKEKDIVLVEMLKDSLHELSSKQNFSSLICMALEPFGVSDEFISRLLGALNLPLTLHLLIGLGLSQSTEPSIQEEGVKLVKAKMPEVAEASSDKLSVNVMHELLCFLATNEGFTAEQKSQVMQTIQALLPESSCPLVLRPLVHQDADVKTR